jgi:hypothetical protein
MIDVYALIDPITGLVRYIGKSKNVDYRFHRHLYESRKNTRTHKCAWIKGLLDKNLRPELLILDTIDEKDWVFWEIHYINLYKSWEFNLTNMIEGGGAIPTFKGDKNPSKREEVRRKISEGRKGMKFSEEHKKNLSRTKKLQKTVPPSRKGVPWTEDQRLKVKAVWAAKREHCGN